MNLKDFVIKNRKIIELVKDRVGGEKEDVVDADFEEVKDTKEEK